jgi:hypothetical protein
MAFPSVAALQDDFNRASLGANWTVTFGTAAIVGSTVLGFTVAPAFAVYNAAQFGPDVEAYVTVATLPASGQQVGIHVRDDIGDAHYVDLAIINNGDGTFQFVLDDTSGLNVTLSASTAFVAGDKIGLQIVGNQVTAWKFHGGAWSQVGAAQTTTRLVAGYVGLWGVDSTSRLDDLFAGTISSGTVTDFANAAAAVSAGYTKTQRTGRTAANLVQYVTELSIRLTPPGETPVTFMAVGVSTVDANTADAAAVASLNKKRKHRYCGSPNAPDGTAVINDVRGNAQTLDVS